MSSSNNTDAEGWRSMIIPEQVMPAPRPRRSPSGGVYMPAEYKAQKARLAMQISAFNRGLKPCAGDVSLRIEIMHERPKKTVLSAPRGDVDNYAKGVMDAANGILWVDDVQIMRLDVTKTWGPANLVTIQYRELGPAPLARPPGV